MKPVHRILALSLFALCAFLALSVGSAAQAGKDTLLTAAQAAKLVPTTVYFDGKSATTQLRNAGGVHYASGPYTLAVLVDTSGYSTAVQQKYQGYLLTDVPLSIGGQTLASGAYGMGFAGGQFVVLDVGNHQLLSAPAKHDTAMKHPRPLQVLPAATAGSWRLCSGRDCVDFSPAS